MLIISPGCNETSDHGYFMSIQRDSEEYKKAMSDEIPKMMCDKCMHMIPLLRGYGLDSERSLKVLNFITQMKEEMGL